jgi:uncharacterized protein (UPF0335 family)
MTDTTTADTVIDASAKEKLRSYIERIERIEEEKTALSSDIKDIMDLAKSDGFDAKVMRDLLKLRKMDPADRRDRDAVLTVYMHALGMLDGEAEAA